MAKAKERLWLHTALACQLSMIQRNRGTIYSWLWHPVSVNDLFKQQTWKQPKLMELDKVLYRLLTAICSKGKLVSGPVITEYAKSVTDKYTFPVGSNKKLPISVAYILSDNPEYLIIWHLSVEWVPD